MRREGQCALSWLVRVGGWWGTISNWSQRQTREAMFPALSLRFSAGCWWRHMSLKCMSLQLSLVPFGVEHTHTHFSLFFLFRFSFPCGHLRCKPPPPVQMERWKGVACGWFNLHSWWFCLYDKWESWKRLLPHQLLCHSNSDCFSFSLSQFPIRDVVCVPKWALLLL